MYFDGSKTQEGSWADCVLIEPLQRKYFFSIHLEFKCMKNTVEYEALILGLQKSIDLKFTIMKVVGDS